MFNEVKYDCGCTRKYETNKRGMKAIEEINKIDKTICPVCSGKVVLPIATNEMNCAEIAQLLPNDARGYQKPSTVLFNCYKTEDKINWFRVRNPGNLPENIRVIDPENFSNGYTKDGKDLGKMMLEL